MKKVLFCCQGLWIGGTEKTMIEALKAVDYSKYSVTLYVRNDYTDLLNEIPEFVETIINRIGEQTYDRNILLIVLKDLSRCLKRCGLKTLAKKINRLYEKIRGLIKIQKEKKCFFSEKEYDIAIAYDMAKDCSTFVRKAIKAKRKIAFYHASTLEPAKAAIYRDFDNIVCVNRYVAETMIKDYPYLSNRITAIENYLSPDTVYNVLKQDRFINKEQDALILVTTGRIWPVKRYDLAVEAARILQKNDISFHWYFVGDGELKEEIRNLIIEYGLSDRITISGFVNNPYKYTDMCDIYVQTSESEAHATTILEAMIMGKAIISTDTTAGKYFHDTYNSCILVQKDACKIAELIIELYKKPENIIEMQNICRSINWSEVHNRFILSINNLLMVYAN